MEFPVVLVRTKAHRYLLLVFALLAVIPAGMLILAGGEPEAGGIAARLARGGPTFLITAGALGMLYLMILLTNYLVLEVQEDVLTFRGAFGRAFSARTGQLEKVTAGRALYSFQFRLPKERSVSLFTYMGSGRFMEVLRTIAERRKEGGSAFRFEYAGKHRDF